MTFCSLSDFVANFGEIDTDGNLILITIYLLQFLNPPKTYRVNQKKVSKVKNGNGLGVIVSDLQV